MNKKFLIYYNRKFEPVIVLSVVRFHKEIDFPSDFGKCAARAGGGWWEHFTDGTLRLYSSSDDFGKYDIEAAKEAFENKNVYYFDEPLFEDEDWNITKLVCE